MGLESDAVSGQQTTAATTADEMIWCGVKFFTLLGDLKSHCSLTGNDTRILKRAYQNRTSVCRDPCANVLTALALSVIGDNLRTIGFGALQFNRW